MSFIITTDTKKGAVNKDIIVYKVGGMTPEGDFKPVWKLGFRYKPNELTEQVKLSETMLNKKTGYMGIKEGYHAYLKLSDIPKQYYVDIAHERGIKKPVIKKFLIPKGTFMYTDGMHIVAEQIKFIP